MVGNRLGRTALSRSLRQWCDVGRSKALSHQTWTERFPRCRRVNSVTLNFLSRTFCVGRGGRAGRISTNFSLTGTQRAGERRNRSQMAIGGAVLIIAAALLAREGYLPESFADWDDELVWEEVYDMAQLSNMATKSHSFITRWFVDRGYTGGLIVRDLIEASSRYILHVGHLPGKEQHRVHHIAIRGTVSLKELKANLKTRLVFDEECGCNLHEGFKGLSDAVADDIEQFLEPGAEIKICGHSLGGAIAVIVAAKLKLRGHKVGVAMTFGAPMVTDGPGAEHLRGIVPVLRVTHETDLIPLVPLTVVPPLLQLPIIAAREEGSSKDRKAFLRGRRGGERRVVGICDVSDGSGRELESLDGDGDGVFYEKGRRREQEVGRSGYSHFGRQLVLLQRNRCMECRREEATKSSSSIVESRPHMKRRGTSSAISWDDIWGPPGSVSASSSSSSSPECKHCPSRGMTYYDTDSGQGSFFDSVWVRLPSIPYTHRMMYYEAEVASRMEHDNRSRNNQREEPTSLSPQASSGSELPVPRHVPEH